jgi:elongation factor Ts
MADVTLDLIKELRDRTGIGMMDCKKVLIENNGDVEKSIEVLRKKGALAAEKRAGNKTSQGIVHAYIHPGAQVGVLLEVNCETDFVARNDLMKQFAIDLCMHIAAFKPMCVGSADINQDFLAKEKAIHHEKLMLEKKPAQIIEQILEGKMKKLYSEVCLLHQPFIKDDSKTVEDYLKEITVKLGENIKINHFSRFEIGN